MRRPLALGALLLAGTAHAGPTWSLAYHGDFLTHPGAAGRATWSLTGGERAHASWEAEAVSWWHPKNAVPIGLRTGPSLRLDGPRKGTWGAFVHGGAEHRFWAAKTYAVDGNTVETHLLAGHPHGVVATGLELGRLTPEASFDGWFVRPLASFRFPTFHGFGIDLAVQVGARFGGGR